MTRDPGASVLAPQIVGSMIHRSSVAAAEDHIQRDLSRRVPGAAWIVETEG